MFQNCLNRSLEFFFMFLKKQVTCIVCLLIGLTLFSQNSRVPNNPAVMYFNQVLNNIRENYYFINKINLENIIKDISPSFDKAHTTADAYPAIRILLNRLFEKHSGFLTPAETFKLFNDTTEIIYPSFRKIKDSVGYIRLPYYTSSEIKMSAWADSAHGYIYNNADKIKGWIIDLRGNYGGSHLPMIAGLANILGEGLIFSEKNNKGEIIDSYIINGQYLQKHKDKIIYRFPLKDNKSNKESDLPVAVLIDSSTASGGEITAIALKYNTKMKIFGESSAGYPTINKVFLMPDGALLYIVNRILVDRSGHEWIGKIHPDVFIRDSQDEFMINAAVEWILKQ